MAQEHSHNLRNGMTGRVITAMRTSTRTVFSLAGSDAKPSIMWKSRDTRGAQMSHTLKTYRIEYLETLEVKR